MYGFDNWFIFAVGSLIDMRDDGNTGNTSELKMEDIGEPDGSNCNQENADAKK